MILPEERPYHSTQELCDLFNTTMPVPGSVEETTPILKEFTPFVNVCNSGSTWKLWLGITDELLEGVFFNVYTKRPITFHHFLPPYPIGGLLNNCVILMLDGSWVDFRCKLKRCGVCYFERKEFLYLRGLCFDENRRSHFRLSGYYDGRPVLRGFYSMFVIWDNSLNNWLLHDIDKNVTLARSELTDIDGYPLGVETWIAVEPLCGAPSGGQMKLSFSSCSDEQFMCTSGSCIPQKYRCNLRYDCKDGSDEDNCGIVEVGHGYRRHLPPRGPNDTTLIITPSITVARITNVDDMRMTISAEFLISLMWKDDRLTFKHLHSDKETTITKADLDLIWRPQYQITPLEGGQVSLLDDFAEVISANNATMPNFNTVNRDVGYPGASNAMISSERYTAILTCDFDLYVYPFDIQVCSINIGLPREYEGTVEFPEEVREAYFTGTEDLSQYKVKNIAFSPQSQPNRIVINFELHRRQGVVLLSTFVPSVLLLMVSWATLFVRMEFLNVRAVMSLTTLLVLYTLFTNLSLSMPNTAAIKLIDVWFFFIILLIFLNIMVHIFIEHIVFVCPNIISLEPEYGP
ncbi:Gamma-aminobutyric acid receptor subunit beta-like 9, partial [Homarus americanus]